MPCAYHPPANPAELKPGKTYAYTYESGNFRKWGFFKLVDAQHAEILKCESKLKSKLQDLEERFWPTSEIEKIVDPKTIRQVSFSEYNAALIYETNYYCD